MARASESTDDRAKRVVLRCLLRFLQTVIPLDRACLMTLGGWGIEADIWREAGVPLDNGWLVERDLARLGKLARGLALGYRTINNPIARLSSFFRSSIDYLHLDLQGTFGAAEAEQLQSVLPFVLSGTGRTLSVTVSDSRRNIILERRVLVEQVLHTLLGDVECSRRMTSLVAHYAHEANIRQARDFEPRQQAFKDFGTLLWIMFASCEDPNGAFDQYRKVFCDGKPVPRTLPRLLLDSRTCALPDWVERFVYPGLSGKRMKTYLIHFAETRNSVQLADAFGRIAELLCASDCLHVGAQAEVSSINYTHKKKRGTMAELKEEEVKAKPRFASAADALAYLVKRISQLRADPDDALAELCLSRVVGNTSDTKTRLIDQAVIIERLRKALEEARVRGDRIVRGVDGALAFGTDVALVAGLTAVDEVVEGVSEPTAHEVEAPVVEVAPSGPSDAYLRLVQALPRKAGSEEERRLMEGFTLYMKKYVDYGGDVARECLGTWLGLSRRMKDRRILAARLAWFNGQRLLKTINRMMAGNVGRGPEEILDITYRYCKQVQPDLAKDEDAFASALLQVLNGLSDRTKQRRASGMSDKKKDAKPTSKPVKAAKLSRDSAGGVSKRAKKGASSSPFSSFTEEQKDAIRMELVEAHHDGGKQKYRECFQEMMQRHAAKRSHVQGLVTCLFGDAGPWTMTRMLSQASKTDRPGLLKKLAALLKRNPDDFRVMIEKSAAWKRLRSPRPSLTSD